MQRPQIMSATRWWSWWRTGRATKWRYIFCKSSHVSRQLSIDCNDENKRKYSLTRSQTLSMSGAEMVMRQQHPWRTLCNRNSDGNLQHHISNINQSSSCNSYRYSSYHRHGIVGRQLRSVRHSLGIANPYRHVKEPGDEEYIKEIIFFTRGVNERKGVHRLTHIQNHFRGREPSSQQVRLDQAKYVLATWRRLDATYTMIL